MKKDPNNDIKLGFGSMENRSPHHLLQQDGHHNQIEVIQPNSHGKASTILLAKHSNTSPRKQRKHDSNVDTSHDGPNFNRNGSSDSKSGAH